MAGPAQTAITPRRQPDGRSWKSKLPRYEETKRILCDFERHFGSQSLEGGAYNGCGF